MSSSSRLRATLAATVMLAGIGLSSTAQAETCSISFTVIKAGWVIGGSGGSGALRCGGRTYPLSIGGLSYGIMFGASETRFNGTATRAGPIPQSNIVSPAVRPRNSSAIEYI